MRSSRPSSTSAFTLLELILVMAIIAIVAAAIIPSFRAFALGRTSSNTATDIIGLANYARTQAAAEGRTYRLNFDPASGEFWLTAQAGGMFIPPSNDFGDHYRVADGMHMDVVVNPQATTGVLPAAVDQQEQPTQAFGPVTQSGTGQPNTLIQRMHQGGLYVEFQPSGRTDPAQIRLTNSVGDTIDIACASATETFRILVPGEVLR
jgi:prepilin-type N-terminal cleavage/methylation domain-containing protein